MIILQCSSGHRMSVAPEYAGKRVRCPQCQEVCTVPEGQPPLVAVPKPAPTPPELGRHVQTQPGAPAPPDYPPRDDRGYGREDRGYGRDERGYGRDERGYGRDDRWDDSRDRRSDIRRDDDADPREEQNQLQTASLGLAFIGWRHLLFGCALVLFGMVAILGIMVEMVVRPPFWDRGRRDTYGVMMAILSIVGFLVLLVWLVFSFIGSGMGCRAPRRSGARGLILGSLICHGAMVFNWLMLLLFAIIASGPGRNDGLAVLAFIFLVMSFLSFLTAQILEHLFIRAMARFVNDAPLGGRAIVNMVLWLCFLVGGALIFIGAGVLMAVSRAGESAAGTVLMILIILFGILLTLAHGLLVVVIARLRSRMRRYMLEEPS